MPDRTNPATANGAPAVPDSSAPGVASPDVVTAAVQALPDAEKAGLVTTAIHDLTDAATAGVVAAALQTLPDAAKADAATAAVHALPNAAQDDLIERFAPDQAMTNDIWRWIVRTFAIVLGGAMVALVAAVIVSFWREVDTELLQMVLTIFTTTAGILAGFVSGRASTARARFTGV